MDINPSSVWIVLLLLGAFHGINPGMGWLFAVALGLQERRRSAVWGSLLPLALGHALAVGGAVLLLGLVGLAIPLAYLRWGVAGLLFLLGLFHLLRHRHPRFGGMRVGFRDLTVWSFLMASAHGAGIMVLPFLFGADVAPAVPAVPATADRHETHAAPPPGHAVHDHAVHDHAVHDHAVHDHAVHDHAVHDHAMHDPGTSAAADGDEHAAHAALLAALPPEPLVGVLATLVHTIGYLLVIGLVAVLVYEKLGLRLLNRLWLNLDVVWAAALMLTATVTLIL